MEKYIAIIKDDIKRFIKNYLIAGELVGMTGMSDLEEYIPSKYPYLSILYLLKQNGLNTDEMWFIENYNSQLIDETSELKKSLGHFLWNKNDVDALTAQLLEMKNKVSSLSKERDELKIQKEELKSQNISLEEENVMLKQKVDNLTSKLKALENTPMTILVKSLISITIGKKKIPFCLIKGKGYINSFFMMQYVVTNEFHKPLTHFSYKNVQSYIQTIKEKYNILLRLPSLSEWQYAACGGESVISMYAGGNDIDMVAWYDKNSGGFPWCHEVGQKKQNGFGLYDMSGNVWEMTEDTIGSQRIVCGGSAKSDKDCCQIRSTTTIERYNESRGDVGFRLVCDIDSIDQLDKSLIE